ncbi:macrophage mannose receptor 1-like [Sebastes umbrosus]|uniref:macrophage mannose receptor 1-like n=1 Tax=Sebastes umbrosus TaxID=72105 RepID=UPI00189C8751|nr:macrophage mannose receptor 1-like [Sebastes umbrosus]
MERIIFLLFLCAVVEGDVGKHIFVDKSKTWRAAQSYCRKHHTDLSSVSSQSELNRLLTAEGANRSAGWIGLKRDLNNSTVWRWSGGTHITYQNWTNGQPDNFENNERYGHVQSKGTWNDDKERNTRPFYCIDINVVEERKTWEEALDYCRDHHNDLTSLHSDTECLLAMKENQKVNITHRVWIGLRYLQDSWLWVNGDRLVYEAWNQGGDQDYLCPSRKRCGALTGKGLWDNFDCRTKLKFICT